MDKYEFNIKVEQIRKLVNKGDYGTAMKIADTIDWKKVHNANLLSMVAQVYEKNQEYQDAKDILLLAFERAPIGKRLLYKLTELALKQGDVEEAEGYYREFCDLAGDDPRQQLLRYQILKQKDAPLTQLISSLESYTAEELDEKWLYELAELYHEAGEADKCVAACDRIMLMFGLGKYVDKAMDLKIQYAPLSSYQMDLVENREKYEAKLRAIEQNYQGSPANGNARNGASAPAEPSRRQAPATPEPAESLGIQDTGRENAEIRAVRQETTGYGRDDYAGTSEPAVAAGYESGQGEYIPSGYESAQEGYAASAYESAQGGYAASGYETAQGGYAASGYETAQGGYAASGYETAQGEYTPSCYESVQEGHIPEGYDPVQEESVPAGYGAMQPETPLSGNSFIQEESVPTAQGTVRRVMVPVDYQAARAGAVQGQSSPAPSGYAPADSAGYGTPAAGRETAQGQSAPAPSGYAASDSAGYGAPAAGRETAQSQSAPAPSGYAASDSAGYGAPAAGRETAQSQSAPAPSGYAASDSSAYAAPIPATAQAYSTPAPYGTVQTAVKQAETQATLAMEMSRIAEQGGGDSGADTDELGKTRVLSAIRRTPKEDSPNEAAEASPVPAGVVPEQAFAPAPSPAPAPRTVGDYVIVESRTPERGLAIATAILRQIRKETGIKNPVAKTTGSKLNKLGVRASAAKLDGKDLMIEEAGDLEAARVEELEVLMAGNQYGMRVLLVDNPKQLEAFCGKYPTFASYFEYIAGDGLEEEDSGSEPAAPEPAQSAAYADNSAAYTAGPDRQREQAAENIPASAYTGNTQGEVPYSAGQQAAPQQVSRGQDVDDRPVRHIVPVRDGAMRAPDSPDILDPPEEEPLPEDYQEEMDIDEFAQYACKYASEIDCSITGKNMLALYERIEIMEEDNIPLTRANAEALIEEAADRAEKPTLGRRIRGLFSSKYDKQGLLILKEEHFL